VGDARAQTEIAPFRLTDVSGDFSARYSLDDWRDESPGANSRTSAPTWEQELNIQTKSYIYHPAFLNMDIGGGPLLSQYEYESDQGKNDGSDTLYNFNAALNFLSLKAYPFTLFYRREHPELTTGLSGRFLSNTDEFGARGVLRPPLTPMRVRWEASHWNTEGSGVGTSVDESLDRASVRTSLNYRARDVLRINLDWNERDSKSGSPGLPIQQSVTTSSFVRLDSENSFGEEAQVAIRQYGDWSRQETEVDSKTEEETVSYVGVLKWKHSEETRSNFNLRYSDTDREDSFSRAGIFGGYLDHALTDRLSVTGGGDYSRDEAPGFTRDVAGGKVLASYRQPLPFGSLGLGGSIGVDRTDQDSDTDRVTVFDESHVLVGTQPVALNEDFVVTETVVVTNVPKTQTFLEDVDYRLVTIGETTAIERIPTGNILDGQEVLVTYDYLTGGTVEFDTLTQSYTADLSIFEHASLFARLLDLSNEVRSGVATTPLNDRTVVSAGGRIDYPVFQGWTAGGEYQFTDRDEDISSSVSHFYRAYLQSGRYWNTTAQLGAAFDTTDNEDSPEDVNRWRYTLGVNSWLPGGLVLGYNTEYSEDDGGTLDREEWRHSLSLRWSYRRVRFSLNGDYSDITQGDNRRETTRVWAELRRTF
jgi:hypothetical protein